MNYHNNKIKQIKLYKKGSTWGFDDSNLGLIFEPFVGETNNFFDYVINNISQCKNKQTPTVLASTKVFPDLDACISLDKKLMTVTSNGVWYHFNNDVYNNSFWFCEVFHLFFNGNPEVIFIKFID